MFRKNLNLIIVFIIFVLFGWGLFVFAQMDLQYQRRGDHYYEGVKPRPVSGYDIELISVLVNYREYIGQMPNQLKVKFYLKETSDVYLTVRELKYKHYYWLDRVNPVKPWRPGFDNFFEWPTDIVIKRLKGMAMYDLGVLIRLGNENPTSVERVAPAIFYHLDVPQDVTGYLFTFKINSDARISCSIYKVGEETAVYKQIFRRKLGGRPFTVRWDAFGVEAGVYKMLITGYFLSTNARFQQSVEFYHQPNTG
ncbi:MAG: hypothetical protein GWN00_29905 [Aliifodinibius sp.]|nr:hypothetical protein [Fodinibius sp.]NIY28853.1 hypothetical protein [Fodinibius sp.]